jgi:hypothetical protein
MARECDCCGKGRATSIYVVGERPVLALCEDCRPSNGALRLSARKRAEVCVSLTRAAYLGRAMPPDIAVYVEALEGLLAAELGVAA